jgi:hypothetical protein
MKRFHDGTGAERTAARPGLGAVLSDGSRQIVLASWRSP